MANTSNNKVPFRVFVASSLNLQEPRTKIQEIIQELNAEEDIPFEFSLYRFEHDDVNTTNTGGAQAEINSHIDQSHAFIMLCTNVVGMKTIEEFRHALHRFNGHKIPAFIAIYRLDTKDHPQAGQVSFDDFRGQNLTLLRQTEDGQTVVDQYTYEYTAKSWEELLVKFKSDLVKWIGKSEYRPLFNAMIGQDITPEYLYSDKHRRENCDEKIYFHRNIDDILYSAMSEEMGSNSILILGDSLSGKTRALYQAIKSFPDAWFYKFSSDPNEAIVEINQVVTYLSSMNNNTAQIFLVIDDIHLLQDSNNIALREAIDRLAKQLIHRVKLIATATAETSLIKFGRIVKINPMSDDEYVEAKLFCIKHAIQIEEGYRAIGAMMINLREFRSVYEEFLTDSTIDKRSKSIRRAILESIKAASIWHRSNIGDAQMLCDFASFISSENIDDISATLSTIAKQLPGISFHRNGGTTVEPKTLQIEEYIYRYILDYDGGVLETEPIFMSELQSIQNILSYTARRLLSPDAGDSIIITLSKVARRAEFREQLARIIYDIVMGIYNSGQLPDDYNDEFKFLRLSGAEKPEWYNILCREIEVIKAEINANPKLENERASLNVQYMSKILWARIHLATTFDEACGIFNQAPHPLQSLAMLAALIDKCGDKDESAWSEVVSLPKFEMGKESFYIIARMVARCKDFDKALEIIRSVEKPYVTEDSKGEVDIYKYVDKTNQLYNHDDKQHDNEELFMLNFERNWFITTINNLALLVGNIAHLNELLEIIRDYYVLFLNNMSLVERFFEQSDIYNCEDLSKVDLLAQLPMWTLNKIFESITIADSKSEIPSEIAEFVNNELYPALDQTLEKHKHILESSGQSLRVLDDSIIYTPRYKAKGVVSVVVNAIIKRCKTVNYRVVLKQLFIPMRHMTTTGEEILLRDSFTYGAMLQNKSCQYLDAVSLYRDYIRPHSLDSDEHFRISHFLVNRIMNKVTTIGQYRTIDQLFDEANIRRDVYTYNNALSLLSYDECARQIIPQMFKAGVEFDRYTLGNLIHKAPNVKITAGYFFASRELRIRCEDKRIPTNDITVTQSDGDSPKVCLADKVKEMIRTFTSIFPLPQQHYFWAELFLKRCYSDDDREILRKFLGYLEQQAKDGQDILSDNIIYNNCIKNSSFIRNYNEARSFIEEHNVRVDEYTFQHLQNSIITEHGESGVGELNELYLTYKSVILEHIRSNRTYIYNNRLRIFRSQESVLRLIFIDGSGKEENELCTPLQAVTQMAECGITVDEYTIEQFLKIWRGFSVSIFDNLITLIKKRAIRLSNWIIKTLVEKCKDFDSLVGEQRQSTMEDIYNLPVSDISRSMSLKIIAFYKMQAFDLEKTFAEIDRNILSSVERLYAYTQLFTLHRRRYDSKLPDGIFDQCWALYEQYVVNKGVTPNGDILSTLANLTYAKEDINKIIAEYSTKGVIPPAYFISSLMRSANSYDDVKCGYNEFKELGGRFSQGATDALLRGIVKILIKKRKRIKQSENDMDADKARAFITNLCDYLLRMDAESTYPESLHDFPCFKQYGKGIIVSHNALRELNDALPECYDEYMPIIEGLVKRYYSTSRELDEQEFAAALRDITDLYNR